VIDGSAKKVHWFGSFSAELSGGLWLIGTLTGLPPRRFRWQHRGACAAPNHRLYREHWNGSTSHGLTLRISSTLFCVLFSVARRLKKIFPKPKPDISNYAQLLWSA